MTIDMTQFYRIFFEETAENLASMESELLAFDPGQPDPERINAIFRAAHSIKGSAGTFGFQDLADLTHVMEGLLDGVRRGRAVLGPDLVDALLAAGDVLKAMLAAHQGNGTVAPDAVAQVRQRLHRLASAPAPAGPAAVPPGAEPPAPVVAYHLDFSCSAEPGATLALDNLLAELRELGSLTVLQRPATGSAGSWRLRLMTAMPQAALEDLLAFVATGDSARVHRIADAGSEACWGLFEAAPADDVAVPDAYGFFEPLPVDPGSVVEAGEGWGLFAPLPEAPRAAQPEPAPAPRPLETASIRVGVERVDDLVNLVGELVITQAMLIESAGQLGVPAPRLTEGLAQLQRHTRALQELALAIRMMPISRVFSRFPRVVHDLSAKLGKRAELRLIGEDTELDKGLIEKLTDPLTHLVRNSLDHGIEPPAARRAAGKPEHGTITLSAMHQGGNIMIEVADDGAGLSRERILATARARGLAVDDDASDEAVWALIFEPGFSTASAVTDLSGRGVGMDVVRRNILALNGRIDLQSEPGSGTRITIRLPLTLAILDGLSVAIGGQTYILPLACVIESLEPSAGASPRRAGGRVVHWEDEYLPLLDLRERFAPAPGMARAAGDGIIVMVDVEGARAGLLVDALIGQHQVVIKSLEQNYRRVPGIAGATIMGDGSVVLILDVAGLVAALHDAGPATAAKEN